MIFDTKGNLAADEPASKNQMRQSLREEGILRKD